MKSNIFNLGRKGQADDALMLGTHQWVEDLDYGAESDTKPRLSGELVEVILVVNRSGTTLAPGRRVTWKASEEGPGKAIGGLGGDDLEANGIVDPYLHGNVADGEFFLLVVNGPTKAAYDGSATISVGSKLGGTANGLSDVYVDGTDQVIAYFGVALEAKTSGSAGDLYRARVHFPR